MDLFQRIKCAFSKEQLLLKEERRVAQRNHLKKLFRENKKLVISIVLFSFGFGLCLSLLANSFKIDKLSSDKIDSEVVIACFYDKQCNQKIINLDFTKDKQHIIDVASAFQLKNYLENHPNFYQNASSERKAYIDNILELTK